MFPGKFVSTSRRCLLAFMISLTGCAKPPPDPAWEALYPKSNELELRKRSPSRRDIQGDAPYVRIEVMRTGRYSLISTNPTIGQRDLIQQTVRLSIAPNLGNTVRDGLDHALMNTGYRLCPARTFELYGLFKLPLPAIHHELGPIALEKALQVIAGPSFQLEIDQTIREVCFSLRETPMTISDMTSTSSKLEK